MTFNGVLVLKRNIPQDLDSFTQSVLYPFVGISDDGRVINWRTKSLLKPSVDKNTYLKIMIRVDNNNKAVLLHRLIAEKHLGLPPNSIQCIVNHIDGNKQNNDYHNLEWVSVQENNKHANDTGLRDSCKGFNHHSCKVSEDSVNKACAYMSLHLSNKQIDNLLGLPKGFCNDIRRGKIWQDIARKYDIPTKLNKSNIFYIIKLDNDYLKFGVTNNLERRLIDTRFKSKPFKTELVYSITLDLDIKSKYIEKLIKSSDYIPTQVLSKKQLPFGFSETAHIDSLQDIVELVENYTPT